MKGLFERHIKCPVCENEFETIKMLSNAPRVVKREPDFYTTYSGENPIYYAVFVCPNCGYSAFEKDFKEVSEEVKSIIFQKVSLQWNKRDYGKLRTTQDALEVYKMALLCYTLIKADSLTVGKLAMRIGWLYRELGDPREKDFIKHTITYFERAYTSESLDIDIEEEITVLFILGEYNRQLGNYPDSVRWFSKALEIPEIKKKRHLEQRVREQWSLLSDAYRSKKE